MKKSAQVVMLPTNEKANIWLDNFGTGLYNCPTNATGVIYQHLYILSDEEIKEGDWVYCFEEGFERILRQEVNPIGVNNNEMMKKIIATTDKSLMFSDSIGYTYTNGKSEAFSYKSLPQIPQSFIEKFVKEYNKGNLITEVMVEYEWNKTGRKIRKLDVFDHILKINPDNTIDISMPKDSWSREEVVELIQKYSKECTGWPWIETDEEWIEENL